MSVKSVNVHKLYHQLSDYEADSLDWCDGIGASEAYKTLEQLSESEWKELLGLYDDQTSEWKMCLASILDPKLGEYASRLIIKSALDSNNGVAFYGINCIALYCGVNDGKEGVYLDRKIQIPAFVELVSGIPTIREKIGALSKICGAVFINRYNLLLKILG